MVQENLVVIGFAVVFIGIILIVIGSLLGAKDSKVNFGVGGFIGPIPWGFANSKEMLYLVIGISVVMFILFLLWGLRAR